MKRNPMLRNAFAELNPFVLLAYYGVILVVSAMELHPVMLAISLAGSVLTASCRMGLPAVLKRMLSMLPLALFTALINPVFSHEGATILCYLPGGNPLTLESIQYGLAAGTMLLTALSWFLTISETFTGEKWMYMLGRVIPSLSLILSLIFRFVPKLLRQLRQINDALALSEGNRSRLQRAFYAFSAIISWSLEDAAETADSMRCRGYGLPGRTAYARFRFDFRDASVLVVVALAAVVLLRTAPEWRYFPTFRADGVTAGCVFYAVLCALPAGMGWFTDLRYAARLRRIQS